MEDKIKHYLFCYNLTNRVKSYPSKIFFGILVFIMVSFFKEVVWDLILDGGTPDILDVKSNFEGCYDAIMNKPSKYNQ